MICRCALSWIVLVAVSLPSAFAAQTLWTEVPVRVYDNTGASEAERRPSLALAAAIVSAASVELVWRTCGQSQPAGAGPSSTRHDRRCETPLAPGELAVRIVRSGVVEDGTKQDLPLGDATIDTRTGAGVLATIYLDRVNWMAERAGIDPRALLGRAIAHELGHLLMATGVHGPSGLMRPVWSLSEIRRRQIDDWIFRPQEIAAIKARTLVSLLRPAR